MKKITNITQSQIDRFPEWVEKWVKVGLSCEPADFETAEENVKEIYKLIGRKSPQVILRMSSPWGAIYGGVLANHILKQPITRQVDAQIRDQVYAQVSNQVSTQVRAQVLDQVRDQVSAQVLDQVRAQVNDQVRDQVYDQVNDQVRAQVNDQVRAQVYAQVNDQVRAQVYDQVNDQVRAQVYNQVRAQVLDQVRDQVSAQVLDQVYDQVYNQVLAQVSAQVSTQVRAQVHDQVRAQVSNQVSTQVRAQVLDQVRDQVSAQVHDQVRAQVYNQVLAQVEAQVLDQVRDQVSAQVEAQVHDQVRAQVSNQVSNQVHDQVRDQVKSNWINYRGGNLWASWYAWVSFYRDVMNWENETLNKFKLDESLALSAGWIWYSQSVCAISDRPKELHRNDQGLHCETGPAILWRDGYALYAINGVRVPAWIVTNPEKITIETIKKEENVEVRRVMRERYGEGRYLKDCGAKLVNADYEGARKGAAPRALLKDDEGQQFLVGTDGSTGRVYFMRVSDNVKTCVKAHNELCGFDESRILNKS